MFTVLCFSLVWCCCSVLAHIAPAQFLLSACQMSWTLKHHAVCVCVCVCVCVLWEYSCGRDRVQSKWCWSEPLCLSPLPPLSSQPSLLFHPGNWALGDHLWSVLRNCRMLLTVFALLWSTEFWTLRFLCFSFNKVAEHNLIPFFILCAGFSPEHVSWVKASVLAEISQPFEFFSDSQMWSLSCVPLISK